VLIAVCASSAPMIAAERHYRFAVTGIPAHTLSGFHLHTDYHRPRDEARLAVGDHLTAVLHPRGAAAVHPSSARLEVGGRPYAAPGSEF